VGGGRSVPHTAELELACPCARVAAAAAAEPAEE